jgi:hypothetical protein
MNLKQLKRNLVGALERPPLWDGFGFFKDIEDHKVKFYFFDELAREHGPYDHDPNVPADREAYHVLLTSSLKGVLWVDHPFIAHFIDPFVYAERIAHMGFSGTILLKTKYSQHLMDEVLKYTLELHAKGKNFVYTDEAGKQLTIVGKLG